MFTLAAVSQTFFALRDKYKCESDRFKGMYSEAIQYPGSALVVLLCAIRPDTTSFVAKLSIIALAGILMVAGLLYFAVRVHLGGRRRKLAKITALVVLLAGCGATTWLYWPWA